MFIGCVIFLIGCGESKDLEAAYHKFQQKHPDALILDSLVFTSSAFFIYKTGNSDRPIAIARFNNSEKDGWEYRYSKEANMTNNPTYNAAFAYFTPAGLSDMHIYAGATLDPELDKVYIETYGGTEIQPKYFENKKYWYFLWEHTTPADLIIENNNGDVIDTVGFK